MNKVELAAIVQFIVIIALSIHLTNLNSHKRDLETKEAEIIDQYFDLQTEYEKSFDRIIKLENDIEVLNSYISTIKDEK